MLQGGKEPLRVSEQLGERACEARGSGNDQQLYRPYRFALLKRESQGFAAAAAHAVAFDGRLVQPRGREDADVDARQRTINIGMTRRTDYVARLKVLALPQLAGVLHTLARLAAGEAGEAHEKGIEY